ncbi:MAG: transcription antitermination factor NusB [bacterium]
MKNNFAEESDLKEDKNLENFSRPTSRRDFRSLAFHLIYAMDRFDYQISLEEIIQDFQSGFEVEIEPGSYAVQMAKGVIDSREELDQKIKPLLKNWKIERLGVCTRLILRMALWELMQPDAISSIVINEAIELTKAFAEKDAFRFVNGILDEACKKYNLGDGSEEESE